MISNPLPSHGSQPLCSSADEGRDVPFLSITTITTWKVRATEFLISAISAFLLFQTGALYSLGTFNNFVEAAAPSVHPLTAVWSAARALISTIFTPCMTPSGLVVTNGYTISPVHWSESEVARVRILTLIPALSFSLFAASRSGISTASAFAVNTVVDA